jgi:hypothetical protein
LALSIIRVKILLLNQFEACIWGAVFLLASVMRNNDLGQVLSFSTNLIQNGAVWLLLVYTSTSCANEGTDPTTFTKRILDIGRVTALFVRNY